MQENYRKGYISNFSRWAAFPCGMRRFCTGASRNFVPGGQVYFPQVGPYRPADLARLAKFACLSEVDLVTFDSAGGGTGKSPGR